MTSLPFRGASAGLLNCNEGEERAPLLLLERRRELGVAVSDLVDGIVSA